MEEDLLTLERLFQTAEQRVRQYVAERRRRVNDLQPIHRLPNELLIKTLHLALQNPRLDDYYHRLHTIGLVSSKWAEAITSTPSFWGVIDLGTKRPPGVEENILIKSRSAPLDVVYDSECRRGPFQEIATQQSHRWRSLYMAEVPAEDVTNVMALSMPKLEDLSIRGCSMSVDVDPSGGKLRHVSFDSGELRWPVLMMQNLETIELRRIQFTGCITAPLLDMLRSSPSLIRLALHHVYGIEEDEPVVPIPNDTALVPLDRLRRLEISDLPAPTMHDLMRHIRVPRCRYLSVWELSDPNSRTITHMLPTLRSILEASKSLQIRWWGGLEFIVSTAGIDGVGLDLKQLDITLPAFLAWLLPILQSIDSSPSVALELSPPHAPTTFEDVWPLFDLPCPITSLMLRGIGTISVEPYIEFLASPRITHGTSPPQWPLPVLQTIIFEDINIHPDGIVEMFRSRYLRPGSGARVETFEDYVNEDGQAAQRIRILRLPSPLVLLRLNSKHKLQRRHIEEIESIIRPGKVEGDEIDDSDDDEGHWW